METIRIKDEYIRLGQALKLAGLVVPALMQRWSYRTGL